MNKKEPTDWIKCGCAVILWLFIFLLVYSFVMGTIMRCTGKI